VRQDRARAEPPRNNKPLQVPPCDLSSDLPTLFPLAFASTSLSSNRTSINTSRLSILLLLLLVILLPRLDSRSAKVQLALSRRAASSGAFVHLPVARSVGPSVVADLPQLFSVSPPRPRLENTPHHHHQHEAALTTPLRACRSFGKTETPVQPKATYL
jgi:hypothetical protein